MKLKIYACSEKESQEINAYAIRPKNYRVNNSPLYTEVGLWETPPEGWQPCRGV